MEFYPEMKGVVRELVEQVRDKGEWSVTAGSRMSTSGRCALDNLNPSPATRKLGVLRDATSSYRLATGTRMNGYCFDSKRLASSCAPHRDCPVDGAKARQLICFNPGMMESLDLYLNTPTKTIKAISIIVHTDECLISMGLLA